MRMVIASWMRMFFGFEVIMSRSTDDGDFENGGCENVEGMLREVAGGTLEAFVAGASPRRFQ